MGPGEYEFSVPSGGKGTISIPGEPAAELEALRDIVKGEPVTYLTGTVDNREGTEAVNMYRVNIYTPEGEELQYKGADNYAEELQDKLPSDVPAETYNQFVDVVNKNQVFIDPKEKNDFVLVGPAVPEKIAGVTVYPTGAFNQVEATPTG